MSETRRWNNANFNYERQSSFPSPRHRRCPRQLTRIRGKPRQRRRSASAIKAAKDPAPLSRCKCMCMCMCIASMHPVPAASASAGGVAYDVSITSIRRISITLHKAFRIQFLIYTCEKYEIIPTIFTYNFYLKYLY